MENKDAPTPNIPQSYVTGSNQEATEITLDQAAEPVPPTPDISTKNNSNKLLIVVALVIGIGIAAGAYFYSQGYFGTTTQMEAEQQTPEQTTEEISPPAPTEEVTHTFTKTEDATKYTNFQHGFSFSFSNNWERSEHRDGRIASGFSLRDEAQNYSFYLAVPSPMGFGYCHDWAETSPITVGGLLAETADGVSKGDADCLPDVSSDSASTYVIIRSGDYAENSILITLDYPLDDSEAAKESLEEILATFSFSEDRKPSLSDKLISSYYEETGNNEVEVVNIMQDGDFVKGRFVSTQEPVSFDFIAKQVDGRFEILRLANEITPCSLVEEHDIPESIYAECI